MTKISADELKLEFEKLKDKYIKDLLELKTKIDNYYNNTSKKELSKSKIDKTIRAIYEQINITCLDSDELEKRENEQDVELKKFIHKFFTNLELETMAYIAQDYTTKEIADIYKSKNIKVKTSTIERRKEYIMEKIYKYFPETVIQGQTISTIKEIVYTFHILENDEDVITTRLKHYIKTNL